jgi:hypothetical protein
MRTFDTLNERWRAFRPSKTQALWFGAACIAATLALGFGAAGWVTGGTAEELRAKAADDARAELAAAVCVDEFMQADGSKARLAALGQLSWYERSERVASDGWATMPDRKEPNTVVAIMCATRLTEPKATES